MTLNPHIFRQYDIRGVAETDLTDEAVTRIGKAYGTFCRHYGKHNVVVGRDCRASGPRIQAALVDAIISTGVNVTDIGICPTPCMYFALFHFDKDGGIQVTGSHNPPHENGCKVCVGKDSIFGADIQKLYEIAESGRFATGEGILDERDIVTPYMDWVTKNISLARPLKVVLDAGNGMAGQTAPEIFRRLGCEVVELFCELDGSFPNHHPDPTVEANLVDLKRAVQEHQPDLGIGFDGDADRIGVIAPDGSILWGDQLMILYSRAVLAEEPGATIIGEVKCSSTMYADIAAHGGRGIMWKTGHSMIKNKLKEEGAALGGEMSGHIFFKHRFFGYDDAVYAACRLAEIVAAADRPIHELLADVPTTYATPEIRETCADDIKFAVADACRAFVQADGANCIDVDGMRVQWDDNSWGLIRASNTGPVLVLRAEATTAARRDEVLAYLRGLVAKATAELER